MLHAAGLETMSWCPRSGPPAFVETRVRADAVCALAPRRAAQRHPPMHPFPMPSGQAPAPSSSKAWCAAPPAGVTLAASAAATSRR